MRKIVLILLIAVAVPGIVFAGEESAVRLLVGRSTIIDVGNAIARVSLTSADIADALVTSPNQLLINGKLPGTISMFVWDRAGAIRTYEIVVQRDLAHLNDQLKQLFPGETIDAQSNGKAIVLSGLVTHKDVSEKAMHVAAGYVDKPEEVVTLLQVQETPASNQVLLRVRFAEVTRSAITSLGASLFTGANGYKDVLARSTTSTVAPVFDNSTPGQEKLVFSDFLNLFLFDAKHQLGTVIQALQTKGQFQMLAEPNLVAESGKEASFLAGGEFPVPIAQGSGSSLAISVQYKEFGVRLNFTPLIHGDRVHLKVRPEVSTLDFANGVLLNGFRIPALSTRRAETELELQDGQTFAIAGLLNNSMNSTLQKIPGIGDIPILGLLFKSKAANKEQSELVVMITPQILTRNSAGVTTRLPSTPEPFLAPLPANKLVDPLPPAFTPARSAVPSSPPAAAAVSTPPQPRPVERESPEAAAAIVRALTAPAPRVVDQGNALPSRPTVVPAENALPAVVPADAVTRPLTDDEKKVLERAHKQEEAAKAVDAKERMKQVEADQKKQKAAEKVEREEQAKLAREQAKRDAEATKLAAEHEKKQAELAKKQAELAAKQAELAGKQTELTGKQTELTGKQK